MPARARAELGAYFEALAAQEREPDHEEERRLREAAREADSRFEIRPVLAGGKVVDFERVDPEVEGALIGARRAAERAGEEVHRFARQHLDGLCAERLRESEQVAKRAHEALQAAEGAGIAWRSEQAEWGALLRAAGRDDLLDELGADPFRGLPRPGVEPLSPAPAALVRERA